MSHRSQYTYNNSYGNYNQAYQMPEIVTQRMLVDQLEDRFSIKDIVVAEVVRYWTGESHPLFAGTHRRGGGGGDDGDIICRSHAAQK